MDGGSTRWSTGVATLHHQTGEPHEEAYEVQAQRHPRRPRVQRRRRPRPEEALIDLRRQVREGLIEAIHQAVAATARQLVEDEVVSLVGEPWSRKGDSPLRRGGYTDTTIFLDGEPHLLRRPRVRDRDAGSEHPLPTLRALRNRDALDEDVKERLVRGVSTRNYEGALTSLSEGLGLKRSAVSAAFQRASQKDLDGLNSRPLDRWTFAAAYLDGTAFQDHTCVIAMGIAVDGTKVILGVREGATENAQVVTDLLEDLRDRGLQLVGPGLFIVDGAKALRSSIVKVFGRRALIQLCHVHKARNVAGYLPPQWQAELRRRLRAAWGMTTHEDADQALQGIVRWLERLSESAAASLREGLEETLTVHRLGIGGTLRRTLVTTNPIESTNDIVKAFSRRVKRWSGSSMVLRWVGSGLVKAEDQFRRVKGHAAMPQLVAALESVSLKESKDVA